MHKITHADENDEVTSSRRIFVPKPTNPVVKLRLPKKKPKSTTESFTPVFGIGGQPKFITTSKQNELGINFYTQSSSLVVKLTLPKKSKTTTPIIISTTTFSPITWDVQHFTPFTPAPPSTSFDLTTIPWSSNIKINEDDEAVSKSKPNFITKSVIKLKLPKKHKTTTLPSQPTNEITQQTSIHPVSINWNGQTHQRSSPIQLTNAPIQLPFEEPSKLTSTYGTTDSVSSSLKDVEVTSIVIDENEEEKDYGSDMDKMNEAQNDLGTTPEPENSSEITTGSLGPVPEELATTFEKQTPSTVVSDEFGVVQTIPLENSKTTTLQPNPETSSEKINTDSSTVGFDEFGAVATINFDKLDETSIKETSIASGKKIDTTQGIDLTSVTIFNAEDNKNPYHKPISEEGKTVSNASIGTTRSMVTESPPRSVITLNYVSLTPLLTKYVISTSPMFNEPGSVTTMETTEEVDTEVDVLEQAINKTFLKDAETMQDSSIEQTRIFSEATSSSELTHTSSDLITTLSSSLPILEIPSETVPSEIKSPSEISGPSEVFKFFAETTAPSTEEQTVSSHSSQIISATQISIEFPQLSDLTTEIVTLPVDVTSEIFEPPSLTSENGIEDMETSSPTTERITSKEPVSFPIIIVTNVTLPSEAIPETELNTETSSQELENTTESRSVPEIVTLEEVATLEGAGISTEVPLETHESNTEQQTSPIASETGTVSQEGQSPVFEITTEGLLQVTTEATSEATTISTEAPLITLTTVPIASEAETLQEGQSSGLDVPTEPGEATLGGSTVPTETSLIILGSPNTELQASPITSETNEGQTSGLEGQVTTEATLEGSTIPTEASLMTLETQESSKEQQTSPIAAETNVVSQEGQSLGLEVTTEGLLQLTTATMPESPTAAPVITLETQEANKEQQTSPIASETNAGQTPALEVITEGQVTSEPTLEVSTASTEASLITLATQESTKDQQTPALTPETNVVSQEGQSLGLEVTTEGLLQVTTATTSESPTAAPLFTLETKEINKEQQTSPIASETGVISQEGQSSGLDGISEATSDATPEGPTVSTPLTNVLTTFPTTSETEAQSPELKATLEELPQGNDTSEDTEESTEEPFIKEGTWQIGHELLITSPTASLTATQQNQSPKFTLEELQQGSTASGIVEGTTVSGKVPQIDVQTSQTIQEHSSTPSDTEVVFQEGQSSSQQLPQDTNAVSLEGQSLSTGFDILQTLETSQENLLTSFPTVSEPQESKPPEIKVTLEEVSQSGITFTEISQIGTLQPTSAASETRIASPETSEWKITSEGLPQTSARTIEGENIFSNIPQTRLDLLGSSQTTSIADMVSKEIQPPELKLTAEGIPIGSTGAPPNQDTTTSSAKVSLIVSEAPGQEQMITSSPTAPEVPSQEIPKFENITTSGLPTIEGVTMPHERISSPTASEESTTSKEGSLSSQLFTSTNPEDIPLPTNIFELVTLPEVVTLEELEGSSSTTEFELFETTIKSTIGTTEEPLSLPSFFILENITLPSDATLETPELNAETSQLQLLNLSTSTSSSKTPLISTGNYIQLTGTLTNFEISLTNGLGNVTLPRETISNTSTELFPTLAHSSELLPATRGSSELLPAIGSSLEHSSELLPTTGGLPEHSSELLPATGGSSELLPATGSSLEHFSELFPAIGSSLEHSSELLPAAGGSSELLPGTGSSLEHSSELLPATGSSVEHSSELLPATGSSLEHSSELLPTTGDLLEHSSEVLPATGGSSELLPATGSSLEHSSELLSATGSSVEHSSEVLPATGGSSELLPATGSSLEHSSELLPTTEGLLEHSAELLPATGSSLEHSSELLPAIGSSLEHSSELLPATGSSLEHSSELLPMTGGLLEHSSELLPATVSSLEHSSELLPAIGSSLEHSSELLPATGSSLEHYSELFSTTGSLLEDSSELLPATGSSLEHSSELLPATGSSLKHSSELLPATGASSELLPATGSSLEHSSELPPATGNSLEHSSELLPTTGALLEHSSELLPGTAGLLEHSSGPSVSTEFSIQSLHGVENTTLPELIPKPNHSETESSSISRSTAEPKETSDSTTSDDTNVTEPNVLDLAFHSLQTDKAIDELVEKEDTVATTSTTTNKLLTSSLTQSTHHIPSSIISSEVTVASIPTTINHLLASPITESTHHKDLPENPSSEGTLTIIPTTINELFSFSITQPTYHKEVPENPSTISSEDKLATFNELLTLTHHKDLLEYPSSRISSEDILATINELLPFSITQSTNYKNIPENTSPSISLEDILGQIPTTINQVLPFSITQHQDIPENISLSISLEDILATIPTENRSSFQSTTEEIHKHKEITDSDTITGSPTNELLEEEFKHFPNPKESTLCEICNATESNEESSTVPSKHTEVAENKMSTPKALEEIMDEQLKHFSGHESSTVCEICNATEDVSGSNLNLSGTEEGKSSNNTETQSISTGTMLQTSEKSLTPSGEEETHLMNHKGSTNQEEEEKKSSTHEGTEKLTSAVLGESTTVPRKHTQVTENKPSTPTPSEEAMEEELKHFPEHEKSTEQSLLTTEPSSTSHSKHTEVVENQRSTSKPLEEVMDEELKHFPEHENSTSLLTSKKVDETTEPSSTSHSKHTEVVENQKSTSKPLEEVMDEQLKHFSGHENSTVCEICNTTVESSISSVSSSSVSNLEGVTKTISESTEKHASVHEGEISSSKPTNEEMKHASTQEEVSKTIFNGLTNQSSVTVKYLTTYEESTKVSISEATSEEWKQSSHGEALAERTTNAITVLHEATKEGQNRPSSNEATNEEGRKTLPHEETTQEKIHDSTTSSDKITSQTTNEERPQGRSSYHEAANEEGRKTEDTTRSAEQEKTRDIQNTTTPGTVTLQGTKEEGQHSSPREEITSSVHDLQNTTPPGTSTAQGPKEESLHTSPDEEIMSSVHDIHNTTPSGTNTAQGTKEEGQHTSPHEEITSSVHDLQNTTPPGTSTAQGPKEESLHTSPHEEIMSSVHVLHNTTPHGTITALGTKEEGQHSSLREEITQRVSETVGASDSSASVETKNEEGRYSSSGEGITPRATESTGKEKVQSSSFSAQIKNEEGQHSLSGEGITLRATESTRQEQIQSSDHDVTIPTPSEEITAQATNEEGNNLLPHEEITQKFSESTNQEEIQSSINLTPSGEISSRGTNEELMKITSADVETKHPATDVPDISSPPQTSNEENLEASLHSSQYVTSQGPSNEILDPDLMSSPSDEGLISKSPPNTQASGNLQETPSQNQAEVSLTTSEAHGGNITSSVTPIHINLPVYPKNTTASLESFEKYYSGKVSSTESIAPPPTMIIEDDEATDCVLDKNAFRSMKLEDFKFITEFPPTTVSTDSTGTCSLMGQIAASKHGDLKKTQSTENVSGEGGVEKGAMSSTGNLVSQTESSSFPSEASQSVQTEESSHSVQTEGSSQTVQTEGSSQSVQTEGGSQSVQTEGSSSFHAENTLGSSTIISSENGTGSSNPISSVKHSPPYITEYPKMQEESTCKLKDYESHNYCICSIDNLVKDLRIKFTHCSPEEVNIFNYSCPILTHIESGIILGNGSIPQVSRRHMGGNSPIRKREIIDNPNIDKTLNEQLQLKGKENEVFATPGMKIRIPCLQNGSSNIPENIINYTWTFADNLPLTEGKVQEGEGALTIEYISAQDGGNYTCTIISGSGESKTSTKFEHHLSVVALPTYTISTTIAYNATEKCQPGDADIISLYFPNVLGSLICGSYFPVCNLEVKDAQCVNKSEDYITANISTSVEPMNVIMPTINTSICDVNCEMNMYTRIVLFIIKNLETIEKLPVFFRLAYRQQKLIPTERIAKKVKNEVGTEAPKLIIACPPGFGYHKKTHICGVCERNKFSRGDETFCTLCPAGQYQPMVGSKSCLVCSTPLQDPFCLRIVYSNSHKFRIVIGITASILVVVFILLILCLKSSKPANSSAKLGREEYLKTKRHSKRRNRDIDLEKQEDTEPLLTDKHRSRKNKNNKKPPEPPPPDFL